MSKVFLITWYSQGVEIDKTEYRDGVPYIFISVPQTSHNKHKSGKEMAGDFLARRFKEVLKEMTTYDPVVKYRIRIGDNWTPEKQKNAETLKKQELYGGIF